MHKDTGIQYIAKKRASLILHAYTMTTSGSVGIVIMYAMQTPLALPPQMPGYEARTTAMPILNITLVNSARNLSEATFMSTSKARLCA